MNLRTIALVAGDVVREAIASRYLLVLFGFITLALCVLALSLDLDVVSGSLAAGKLFGKELFFSKDPVAVSKIFAPVFQVIVALTFYVGTPLLMVAIADIAPKMWAPGRVEHMLSLPIRRAELLLGTYFGVLVIAISALALAVGGTSIILFVKADFFTLAPFLGALCTLIGFFTLYAFMLAISVVSRSPALAAALGIFFFIFGAITSNRAQILALIRKDAVRTAAEILLAPVPRFHALSELGTDLALGKSIAVGNAFSVGGGCLALGAFFLVVGCGIASTKDY